MGLFSIPAIILKTCFGWLKKIPDWFWICLCTLVGLYGLLVLHNHWVDRQISEAYQSGYNARSDEFDKALAKANDEARRWRDDYEDKTAALSKQIGETNALQVRNNALVADSLRLRGPGKAAAGSCAGRGDSAGPSSGAGGSGSPPAGPDAPLAPVPSDEPMAIVPWADLVRRAEESDAALSEAHTWRTWYLANEEELKKARLTIPQPAFKQ